MHSTFPIVYTSSIITKMPMSEDDKFIEPSIIRRQRVKVLYLSPSNYKDIENSKSERENGKGK